MKPVPSLARGLGLGLGRQQFERQQFARQLRYSSTEPAPKTVSPHIRFYQTFGRAIFKVLLMATLTYQIGYWGWVKLEKDEIKRMKSAELVGLEKQLKELTKDKKAT